ncbi:sodium/calcium exchanger 2-like isoform X1 [Sesbania bispinosa]|nr:sodium/calcium exchanger 2-like isoform X1 [Sesbania bispinosa]
MSSELDMSNEEERLSAIERGNKDPATHVASRNHQNLTTGRARRMRFEPRVDAGNMEAMVALRKIAQSEKFTADSAVAVSFGRVYRTFFLTPLLAAAGGETEAAKTAAAGDGDEAENAYESIEEGEKDFGERETEQKLSMTRRKI